MFFIALLATLVVWWLSASGVYAYSQIFAVAPLCVWWVLSGHGRRGGFGLRRRRRRRSKR